MVRVEVRCMSSGVLKVIDEEILTVGNLQFYIEQYYGIPIKNQILIYNKEALLYNGKRLDEVVATNAEDNEFKVYTKFPPQNVSIVVLLKRQQGFYINIHSQSSVMKLKMLIDEKYGLSPHRQKLTMGNSSEPMPEWDNLDEHLIKDPEKEVPEINLEEIPIDNEQKLCIGVKKGRFVYNMVVEYSDTIYTLHGMVRRAGITYGDKFYFQWGEKRLLGTDYFTYCGIPDMSTLLLVVPDDDNNDDDPDNNDDDNWYSLVQITSSSYV
ncbi:hypothetical protein FRX31_008467 [Thalictrum thalictroides]|uniref:Ubiquitin-like domain-containing protein n=1 Tax=Thalictrum thalictroides TaxID=46969 RepID=A0A7J6WWZ4_THATH|nr:hypothetical protein FRX31_008467 [Thalictrum thalictroides]